MLNISSILLHIHNLIKDGSERITILDDQHVLDTKTAVKLHLYDDWFKITHDDHVIATMRDFDSETEQPIIWKIKNLITDPAKIEEGKVDYIAMIKERRSAISDLFENPVPIVEDEPIVEVNTVDYMG
tara:strand:- start:2244 stop:2627 length:384 start_codon:yes stop_codon:yes gene_type:complete